MWSFTERLPFYRPQRSCGQGNIFTPVCHSFCSWGEGVCLSACWDTTPPPQSRSPQSRPPWSRPPFEADIPPGQTPPGADTPPKQTHPGADTPRGQTPPEQTPPGRLQHTVYEWPVRIPLECILVIYCI